MTNFRFIVRWTDSDNKEHSKVYSDETTTRKAKKWLIEQSVLSVDIAVRINDKDVGNLKEAEKQSQNPSEQKGFWWQD